jgi:membrane-associated protein
MNSIFEFFRNYSDANYILQVGGLALVTLIVYMENGFFFAFFLPGDYLLFLAGMFASSGQLPFPITLVSACIVGAAICGSFTGYLFGKFLGDNLQSRKDTWYFKKEYLTRSKDFFEKHGGKALILARFMPVIRTFSPIIVGMIKMPLSRFTIFNIAGALAWGVTLPCAGYYLGEAFPWLREHVELIILFFLSITTFAVIRTYLGVKNAPKEEKQPE